METSDGSLLALRIFYIQSSQIFLEKPFSIEMNNIGHACESNS